jgi:PAS domain S-box-containing protein
MRLGYVEQVPGRAAQAVEAFADNCDDVSRERMQPDDTVALTDELAVLHALSAAAEAFTGSQSLEIVLDRLLASVLHVTCADAGSVMLLSPGGESLDVVAARGPRAKLIMGTKQPVDQSVAGWALREDRPVTLRGRASAESSHPRDLSSSTVTPLRVGSRLLGVLNVSRGAGLPPLDDRSIRLLELLANQAAILVHNAQMMQREHIALRERAQLLDLAHEAIIVRDLISGTVSFWNPGAAELYGWTAQEASAYDLHVLLETSFPCPQEKIEAELVAQGRWQGELIQKRQNGSAVMVDSRWALYRDQDGTPTSVLEISTDISERKEAEAQLRTALAKMEAADRMKTEFVSMVSHELRTPLTSINGYVDLFLDEEFGPLTTEQREYLSVVRGNGERLLALINDLLDAARLASGMVVVKQKPVNLTQLIESAAHLLHPQLASKSQHLSLDLDDHLPPVRGDANRLTQVLVNLLSNAHKYTPPLGEVSISTSVTSDSVRVDIRDTGIGLTEAEQMQLFTKFFRADNDRVREAGGTGLGLVITRSLIELHGGQISVKSAPDRGSTFSFTLPLVSRAPDDESWFADARFAA